jgi:hypothetical protein
MMANKRALSPHGTANRYKYGCGCDECKEANRIEMMKYLDSNPLQREAARMRIERRRAKAAGERPRRPKTPCPECGQKFLNKHGVKTHLAYWASVGASCKELV